MANSKTVLSLFSGCGGMDIGFEGGFWCLRRQINEVMHHGWAEQLSGSWSKLRRTGFETVFANDIRVGAKAAWERYFGRQDVYHLGSVVDLLSDMGGQKIPTSVDVVTGGFPCQDFSVAGSRKGFASSKDHYGNKNFGDASGISRGQLYLAMRDVVSIAKPKVFVAENVKGLTSLGNAKATIERDFALAADGGYIVIPAQVLQAANYGVPQSRERVIFYGFRRSALRPEAISAFMDLGNNPDYNPYPLPTHAYSASGHYLLPFVTAEEALAGLDEPDKTDDEAQKKYSHAKYLCGKQGNTEIKLKSVAPTIRSEHHGNIEYRRLSADNGGGHSEELAQGLAQRGLTVRECARLQTFPDDYQLILPKSTRNAAVSASEAYKLIGNAVPCMLAYNIAMRLSDNWGLYFGDNC